MNISMTFSENKGSYDYEREQMKSEFESSTALREEFSGDLDAYISYKKAYDAGLVKILRGRISE